MQNFLLFETQRRRDTIKMLGKCLVHNVFFTIFAL